MRNIVLANFKSWVETYYSNIEMKNYPKFSQSSSSSNSNTGRDRSNIGGDSSNSNSFAKKRVKNFVGHFEKD